MRYRYIFYILALLPAFFFRDFTPSNELRYISIVEEALRNNTWFTFFNHGEAYADKPPLYFWLMMLSRLITGGHHMWLIGLFSLIPAAGTMFVMDRWFRGEKVKHNPIISNLMLGTTAIFMGSALVLRMDMLMTFFIVLALYTFFRLYRGTNRPYKRWMLPVYIFLAIFSKGAMGVLIPLISMAAFLALRKKLRDFGRYMGWRQWGILVGLCAAWFSLIYLEGGLEYLNNILFKQTVGRGVNSFHHKEHLFYYFPRMLYTFAPWSLLYLVAIWRGVRKKLFVSETEKFFYTVIWVNVILLSIISSKLDIYMLPIYPFVAYLASSALSRSGNSMAIRVSIAVPAAIFALIFPASFFLTGLIPFEYDDLTMVRMGLLALSLGGAAALYSVYKDKSGRAVSCISLGMLAMIFLGAFSLPQFNREIGFGQMAAEAAGDARANDTENYVYYKFHTAPNMNVYLGKELEYAGDIAALDSLDELTEKSVLFVRAREVRLDENLKGWLDSRAKAGSAGDYSWFVIGGPRCDSLPEAELR